MSRSDAGPAGGPPGVTDSEASWHERRRVDLVGALLPREFYGDVFEPACGAGELSAMLAARCEYLLASDRDEAVVLHARRRLAAFNADVVVMDVRSEWPERRHDLIVLSELVPYLSEPEATAVLQRALASLVPEGHLVVGHWRRRVRETGPSGDEVSARVRALPDVRLLARYEDPHYVIDVLGHAEATVPAEDEGLVAPAAQ